MWEMKMCYLEQFKVKAVVRAWRDWPFADGCGGA
jgi:hypothetical protein